MTSRAKYIVIRFLSGAGALLLVLVGRIAPSQVVQSEPAAAPAAPAMAAFDVADVHASPFTRVPRMDGPNLFGDRYVLRQATMTEMIAAAYKLDPANVHDGPDWLDWNHYDIIAKAPPSTSRETLQLMLQSLLAERFSLVVHKGIAPMPSYLLTAQIGKTKLKESDGKGESGCIGRSPPADQATDAVPQIRVTCHNETMEKLCPAMCTGWRAAPTWPTRLSTLRG